MKKFFKIFFSRLTIVALAIIIQVLFLVGVISFFGQYYVIIQIAAGFLAMLVLIHIVNRDMSSDGKIAWVIVVGLFPVFGVIVYVLFSQNKISFKQRRLLKKLDDESISAIIPSVSQQAVYEKQLGRYYGQSHYLLQTGGAPLFVNTETKYFPSGEDFWEDLLKELEKAEKYIFMEYFIVERGKMFDGILDILRKKVAQGVEVRLMYDDVGSISKVPGNFHKQMNALGIKCIKFNPFNPIMSAVHNNRDHRKITVIDGAVGYVGGINLADEYINEKQLYGYWKDTAVRLRGEGVQSLTVMFLQAYDVMTEQLDNFNDYLPENYEIYEENGMVIPFGDGPRPHYNELIGENVYLNIINQAQKYLYITTPYLIIDDTLTNALRAAALRGVDVKIITPHIPDKKLIFNVTRYSYAKLMKAGVKIYEFRPGFMHAKSFVADDEIGVVGTINLDYRSLMHHYECAVWMCRTQAVADLRADFDNTLAQSIRQTPETAKLNGFQRFICRLIAIFRPMM